METCGSTFNANFLHNPKSRDVGLVTIAQWADTIVGFVGAFRVCLQSECRTSVGSSVLYGSLSWERAGLRNRILRSECCRSSSSSCLLSVARRLLLFSLLPSHISHLFGFFRFSEKVQGILWISSCVFSGFGFVCLLAAGHAARGVPSSIQAEKRELRLGLGTGTAMGLGSDRESAALFVLASWRVLCVCCNQTTNDHKKSSSSSSALRLPCVVVVVVFILMPQAARLHFKARSADPAIRRSLGWPSSSLVWFWFLVYLSIPFDSFRFLSLYCCYFISLFHALFSSCLALSFSLSSDCCIFLLTCRCSLPLMS